jgi:hypothetical protein
MAYSKKYKHFSESFGPGDAEFLTPLDEPARGNEPGPQELVVSKEAAPDPLGYLSSIPSAPVRKVKGA